MRKIFYLSVFSSLHISCTTIAKNTPREWYLRGALQNSILGLEASNNDESESSKEKLLPASAASAGLTVGNELLSVSLSTSLEQSESDELKKGESNIFDLQTHGSIGHIGYDVWYQKYQGFYLEDAIDESSETNSYVQFEDMYLERIGVAGFWIFSPKNFDYSASFDQSSLQKKSGGSWLLFSSIDKFKISNLPTEVLDKFQENLATELNIASVGWMGGYGYRLNYSPLNYWLSGVVALPWQLISSYQWRKLIL